MTMTVKFPCNFPKLLCYNFLMKYEYRSAKIFALFISICFGFAETKSGKNQYGNAAARPELQSQPTIVSSTY